MVVSGVISAFSFGGAGSRDRELGEALAWALAGMCVAAGLILSVTLMLERRAEERPE